MTQDQSDPKKPFNVADVLRQLEKTGVPMAADTPFDIPESEIRQQAKTARSVVANCRGGSHVVFTEAGDGSPSLFDVLEIITSASTDPDVLVVECDVPTDIQRLGRIIEEVRGFSLEAVDGELVKRLRD